MIPLMKTAFTDEKETCIKLADFIKSIPKLSMGEKCKEFENKFSDYQGRKHSILVNSGGSANFLLLQVLKNMGRIKQGDNVAFSSLTWATNVMPIIQMGFNPIPLDCSESMLNVTSFILEEAIEKYNIKVFFSTNVLGFASDLFRVKEICEKYGVLYIEDNCESFGTEIRGVKTGNFGFASTFSFFVAHHMSTIEGGMICTDDDELAMNLIMSRANGWDRNLQPEQQKLLRDQNNIESEFESKYSFYDIGMNVRPTEITGFLGIEQLKNVGDSFLKREYNYIRINQAIMKNKELKSIYTDHLSFISNFSIPIIAINKEYKKKYVERFKDKVEIRPLIAGNIIKQPFWYKHIGIDYNLKGTDRLHECSFYFGNYPEMNEQDLEQIEELLK